MHEITPARVHLPHRSSLRPAIRPPGFASRTASSSSPSSSSSSSACSRWKISDSYFRHDHAIARSLFVLPLPAALFWGICTRHRWAWWTTRILALLVAILYALPSIGIWFLYPHLPLGLRLWITVVGAILCAFVLSVHLALGRPAARTYFFARKTGH
ncbi:hypothetical protein CfE428DRAFT_1631 [Chthoniobacter flavus Ellin428]|uniref:Uncharacterized protein n=1 Tax=Chthoniobacter flavus Ellin428 TaxID=497964 RepID=B4CX18_9BACT|nr:hypothetical protein [Chthoniobacter flavus]EDY21338.1 hypothetical protein CfE428DRAFT_1631 [Chthoniobacter flavus Ellin428]